MIIYACPRCARWVPKCWPLMNLTRITINNALLARFYADPEMFKCRLVTGDETWVYCYDPESTSESMQWKLTGLPRTKKFANQQKAYGHSILGRWWGDTCGLYGKKELLWMGNITLICFWSCVIQSKLSAVATFDVAFFFSKTILLCILVRLSCVLCETIVLNCYLTLPTLQT